MNGPMPTMNVTFSDVASISPSPRSSFPVSLELVSNSPAQPLVQGNEYPSRITIRTCNIDA